MKMPALEYNAWAAFYQAFPFGDVRGDLQAGVVASVIANVHRGKSSSGYNPADFMPQFGDKSKPTPDQVIEAKISKFMRRYH